MLNLDALRRAALTSGPVLPADVLALLDHIDGMEAVLSLHQRQLAEQAAYITELHSLVLAWAQAIERCDGIVDAEQALLRFVAGFRRDEGAIVSENPLHKSTARKTGPRPKQPRICTVAGCTERAWKNHAYCPKHHLRWMRHGDPLMVRTRGRKARQD